VIVGDNPDFGPLVLSSKASIDTVIPKMLRYTHATKFESIISNINKEG